MTALAFAGLTNPGLSNTESLRPLLGLIATLVGALLLASTMILVVLVKRGARTHPAS